MIKIKNKIHLLGGISIVGIASFAAISCASSDEGKENNIKKDVEAGSSILDFNIKVEDLKKYAEEARKWNIDKGAIKVNENQIQGQELTGENKYLWISFHDNEKGNSIGHKLVNELKEGAIPKYVNFYIDSSGGLPSAAIKSFANQTEINKAIDATDLTKSSKEAMKKVNRTSHDKILEDLSEFLRLYRSDSASLLQKFRDYSILKLFKSNDHQLFSEDNFIKTQAENLSEFNPAKDVLIGVKENHLNADHFDGKISTKEYGKMHYFKILGNSINFDYSKLEDKILDVSKSKLTNLFNLLLKITKENSYKIEKKVYEKNSNFIGSTKEDKIFFDFYIKLINQIREYNVKESDNDSLDENILKSIFNDKQSGLTEIKKFLRSEFEKLLKNFKITTSSTPGYYGYNSIYKNSNYGVELIEVDGYFSQNQSKYYDKDHKDFRNPVFWSLAKAYTKLIENPKSSAFNSTREKLEKLNLSGNLIEAIYKSLLSKFKLISSNDSDISSNVFDTIGDFLKKDNFSEFVPNFVEKLYVADVIYDKNDLIFKKRDKNSKIIGEEIIQLSQFETNESFKNRFLNHQLKVNKDKKIGEILGFKENPIFREFATKGFDDIIAMQNDLSTLEKEIEANVEIKLTKTKSKSIKVKKNSDQEEVDLIESLIKNKQDKIYLPKNKDISDATKIEEAIKYILKSRHGLLQKQLESITITPDVSKKNALKANFAININGEISTLENVVIEKYTTDLIKPKKFKNNFRHIFDISVNDLISTMIDTLVKEIDNIESEANFAISTIIPNFVDDLEKIANNEKIDQTISLKLTNNTKTIFEINKKIDLKSINNQIASFKSTIDNLASNNGHGLSFSSSWKIIRPQINQIKNFLSHDDGSQFQNKTALSVVFDAIGGKDIEKNVSIISLLRELFVGPNENLPLLKGGLADTIKAFLVFSGSPHKKYLEIIRDGFENLITPLISILSPQNQINSIDFLSIARKSLIIPINQAINSINDILPSNIPFNKDAIIKPFEKISDQMVKYLNIISSFVEPIENVYKNI